jgi:nuclear transcription factor Y gamma
MNAMHAPHTHLMQAFWQKQMQDIENGVFDFKQHQLPLARIKKVMKTDEDVKVLDFSAHHMDRDK